MRKGVLSILLLTALLVPAVTVNGQDISTAKITLGLNQENMETAIRQMEQKTDFIYYYRKADIKTLKDLSLPFETRTVEQTLQLLFKNTFITFRQVNKNIFIEKSINQTGYEIKGRIVGADYKAVNYATVSIQKINNGHPVQTVIADSGGDFILNIESKGDYLVNISAVGRDSLTVSITLNDLKVVTLPDITLITSSKQLKEITIVAKRPFIEQKTDRTIVNVDALASNTGANALEVLAKSPGVLVDHDGKITFKGKTGVMVLIDDKPVYLSGDNLSNYLKTLPASQLDQIELMSNPPAKYDASGNAGLINIKTKKSAGQGFNGSVSASAGHGEYWSTNESISLNYRAGNVNIFANADYNIQNYYRRLDVSRSYFDATGNLASSYTEVAYFHPVTYNPNLKLGMDYYLSPKTTMGIILTGLFSSGHDYNPGNNTINDPAGKLDSTITADNNTKSKFYNEGINLNYRHQFDNPDNMITFDLDYIKYNNNNDQSFLSSSYNAAGIPGSSQIIVDNLPTNINIYAAKADYSIPLKGKAKLEAGIKTSFVNTDNAANYFNVADNVSSIDNNLTNRFLYHENINAAYTSFSKDFRRITIQAGLRAEHTIINGHQLGNVFSPDSSFTKYYINLFPTAYLTYKLDTSGYNSLNFSFGRRIDRPYYQDLNPFISIIDKYTYIEGNTYLKPQYSSDYELSYRIKSVFSVSLVYSYINDYQVETDRQKGNILIAQTSNIGRSENMGINANVSLSPVKWWEFNLYAEMINNSYHGPLYNSYLNTNHTHFYFNENNQFDLSTGWSADLSCLYVSKVIDGQFVHIPQSMVSLGIQKKVFKNKGSIKLAANDLFRGDFAGGRITNIPGVAASFHSDEASRAVIFGFTYNFGNSANSQKKQYKGSAETEKSRVKN